MSIERADVLRQVDAAFPDSTVVLTLGGTVREMLAVAGRKGNHFISLDAMGQTISLALGLALGLEEPRPTEKVVAIEGDGSLLMGLSVMSTVGHLKPKNLVVFVLDNGVYLATGAQPTAAGDIDMVTVAKACGWVDGRDVRTPEELSAAVAWALSAQGPILIRVYIGTAQIPTSYFLEDPVILAEDFRRWLRAEQAPTSIG
ncbi:MAG: phosphonopyruvate decarboxylase [Frankiales bacterium]|nr:phosphonopyruvate decarboxylase [Frankiales bacterium]